MASTLAEVAAEAYVTGWAISGGPMTPRVAAGCEAAVTVAAERRHHPDVLEVSLHLGHLEGTWAEVYRRREDLTARLAGRIARRWHGLVKDLDPRDLLTAYRRNLALREDDAGKPSPAARAAARAASLEWLEQVLSDPAYRDLASEITEAIIASMAEGQAAQLAIAADQAAALGFDWATAYNAMYAGLAGLRNLPEMDAPWAQAIIQAGGADAGKLLATMAASGASDEEIAGTVFGGISDAVLLAIDTAISGSFAQGALSLYAAEGTQVGWASAADGRVCPSCQDNEDNSPYDPAAFPALPDHPRCRCTPYPYSPLPWSAFAQFLVPVG